MAYKQAHQNVQAEKQEGLCSTGRLLVEGPPAVITKTNTRTPKKRYLCRSLLLVDCVKSGIWLVL